MISTQLWRTPAGRVFCPGIEVARAKDLSRGMRADNQAAVRECVRLLVDGGALFVLPEATGDLGFRHLPFRRGAARILQAVLAEGVRRWVVPLGIH